ncbi:serine/threonine dehydratase [Thalassobaculum fulvum]|uniref:Serine/threonine dehydratase n=1 Tax=Thalassobaculum fulvum TaxID=1633335 RepID=A0A918XX54_9PROT|nr:threonine/serine dehydratase [Thalassobaculum fulvum]GHD63149.1 serine/threonine dehydratase [Thalassobaculum fulvum]
MSNTVTLADINAARGRIAGKVRLSPVLEVGPARTPVIPDSRLVLKLDCLQPTGSFKVRGATNALLSLPEEQVGRGLITASGGNHGLAVAYAARMGGTRAVVYLPTSAPAAKAEKLKAWGAEVVIEGSVFDEAAVAATARAEAEGMTFLHPFAPPAVIAGQGTVGLEIVEQIPEVDTVLVAIGGGGLIAGVATAIKALRPNVRVVGIEPEGAPTHHASRAAGRMVTLDAITTAAGTLAPRRTEALNFELVSANVDDLVLVSDEAMREAARWLWFECGLAAELSGAAGVAALMSGAVTVRPGATVCALVCGAGTDGLA